MCLGWKLDFVQPRLTSNLGYPFGPSPEGPMVSYEEAPVVHYLLYHYDQTWIGNEKRFGKLPKDEGNGMWLAPGGKLWDFGMRFYFKMMDNKVFE